MLRNINAVAIGVAAMLGASLANADITVVSWPGSYATSQQKAYGAPWEKKSGAKITWETYDGALSELRAQVEAGAVTWDVVDVQPEEAITGCDEGLFVELPYDKFVPAPDGTPMVEDMMVPPVSSCAAPQIFWSYAVFFDKTRYPGDSGPKSLADFYDVEKFPGKRGIHSWARANIEMALVADGVAPDKVYEAMSTREGMDRAFAKLDTLKGHVVLWSRGSQPLEQVKSGEAVMAVAYNGRTGDAILTENQPFEIMWDGQVLQQEYIVIVKGTKNLEEALDFVIFATAPEQQAGQAKWLNYGPMRKSGLDIIAANEPFFHNGANIMPYIPNRDEVMARSVIADPYWWADNEAEVSERFTAWLGN
jgi:putative spermidine/putrescine transport system substrate-binding protein